MIAEVGVSELPERDVWLSADAVPAVEDPRPFLGFDVPRLVLVGRLRRVAVPPSVDAKVVVPVVLAPRRRGTMERIGAPSASRGSSFDYNAWSPISVLRSLGVDLSRVAAGAPASRRRPHRHTRRRSS